MANEEHLNILRRGPDTWDRWRLENPDVKPDLSGAYLSNVEFLGGRLAPTNLSGANLSKATLVDAELGRCNFDNADLSGALCGNANILASSLRDADLSQASLFGASLINSSLRGANLEGADIRNANLSGATLQGANLRAAQLNQAILNSADLADADLLDAEVGYTTFGDNDLSRTLGLESVRHSGPSVVGVDTIYRSRGVIPEVFLRSCGLPEDFITYMRSLTAQPVQFYSCFISYSGKDEEFARRLHSRMREAELRVWFAPENMKGGDKLYDQIDRAIQYHDRLLLVLSESSLRSKWVELEIRRARKVEIREGRRKLFPIRLVGYEALQAWACIDSATGEDMAEEVRSYFIPDFSNWKNHDDLERAFARLLADLKASA